ncbi:MAG TPA: hypothetical protein VH251_02515 [Verrucomicrobiae bacterium]|jgi:glycosyltransferase involved in cell wall biosynthesis|nr:hypothetical protein [Verrucomicrobiae bacterium]
MKQIVMLVGMGNNERGSAQLASELGRTALIQAGPLCHREIWEKGERIYDGAEVKNKKPGLFAELTLGLPGIIRTIRDYRELMENGPCDLIIGTAYGQTLAGLWLRATGKTRKVVCLISDYLPPRGTLTVRIHRRVTGFLVRVAAKLSDEAWAVSPRIPTMKANPHNFVMPLPIQDNHTPLGDRHEMAYIGFPSPDHAIDVLFEICRKHNFKLNIFGDSAYLQSVKHLAPADTVFHGITNDTDKIGSVLARCFCGYAVYRDTSSESYSHYGIPSKCLQLFANNVPVVTTNTADFTRHIATSGSGCVVEPNPDQIERAVLDIRARFPVYFEAINRFREMWNVGAKKFHHDRIAGLLKDN